MLFNSFQFLLFFPLVTIIYYLVPHKYRWMLLLGCSYYFYMCWKPEYIILIMAATLINYWVAIKIDSSKSAKKRKLYLILGIVTSLSILFFYKYLNFFNDSLRVSLNYFNIMYNVRGFKILLPVGISFYTFQTLSYTIDVYRKHTKVERHFGIFALFVSFFPQLVAGPIERSNRLIPQFYKKVTFNYDTVVHGLQIMLWGFFKKVFIADRLGPYVNAIYNNPEQHHGLSFIIATYFFAFQVYCDFSGYTDIARGSAKIVGINLMENFRFPNLARSIRDLWSRWHISLSQWFRDYLYIPLGGNKATKPRWLTNLFVTFLVSGLWHVINLPKKCCLVKSSPKFFGGLTIFFLPY